MAAVYSNEIVTPEFRGSFLHIFKPRESKREDGTVSQKYEVCALFPKQSANWYQDLPWLVELLKEVIAKKWPGGQGLPPALTDPNRIDNRAWPISDGDAPSSTGKFVEEHKGHWVVRMSSQNFNTNRNLLDGRNNSLGTLTEATCFSGCYFQAKVHAYDWSHQQSGAGIGISLNNLKFTREGESFGGGGQDAATAFGVEPAMAGNADAAFNAPPATDPFTAPPAQGGQAPAADWLS
jgi:hypothetical protein